MWEILGNLLEIFVGFQNNLWGLYWKYFCEWANEIRTWKIVPQQCVPSTLCVVAQRTEILTVELDLTPDVSKQPTFHDRVQYPLKIESLCKWKSWDLLFSWHIN